MKYFLIEHGKVNNINIGCFDSIEDFVRNKILTNDINIESIGLDTELNNTIHLNIKLWYNDYIWFWDKRKLRIKYYLRDENGCIVKTQKIKTIKYQIEKYGYIKPYKKYFKHTYYFRESEGVRYGYNRKNSCLQGKKLTGLVQEKRDNITARELGFRVREARNHPNLWDYADYVYTQQPKKSWKRRKVRKQWMSNKIIQNQKRKVYFDGKEYSVKQLEQDIMSQGDIVDDIIEEILK